MINNLIDYAKTIEASEDTIAWIETTGRKALKLGRATESDLEHIIDFFASNAAPRRLLKMSLADAKRKTKEWTERNKKKGRDLEDTDEDIEIVLGFEDGSMIVRLKTKAALLREGTLMSHCLGGYSVQDGVEIYSYRDAKNQPHATFEVRREAGEILQIKGKGNGPIHPKYINPILDFLESLDMKVRTSEMRYLGYYHIDKSNIDFLRGMPDAWKQVAEVRGEFYAF